jgi:hypothetical protein|tara:strand:+ start:24 stop:371 length:348 start_codon:yes stop_codon:yes gene_type:complete
LKVIVAGSRGFNDYEFLKKKLDYLFQNQDEITIISGNARGADTLGETYSVDRNYGLETYPADWDTYGKSAGYRRNAEMAKISDASVIFWDGISKGAKHMIDLSHKYGLKTKVVKY